MYQDILRNISNVAIWPLVSFFIFFTFFLCLLWWTFTADKRYIRHMKEMPLDDGTENNLDLNA